MPENAATTSAREAAHDDALHTQIIDVVRRYWGFDTLRPLQREAIEAGLQHRDSLVVMPTGGGKSLCYQVPPLIGGRTDIVVSPLISLMKDQVDALRACGYPAAAVHSGMSEGERTAIRDKVTQRELRLLFVSPERLVSPRFLSFAQRLNIRAFAIDEAHCISQWGHDFRQEYRQLAQLKERFPGASVHAYTATATPRVRQDIIEQLNLHEPNVLVGRFDRPNLVYRILPRVDRSQQIMEVIRRHPREAVIVYCITRRDTEHMASRFSAYGIRAAAYHAGLEAAERQRVQDAFAAEEIDVVVATVAFGMGIDRSNVRCVIHAAMPKSVEAYQQETGRAGRDGLEAECVLFYSAADVMRWESLIARSASEAQEPEVVTKAHMELLREMQKFCTSPMCRHAALSSYFGQELEKDNCGACDVCRDEVEGMADATTIAQKILSCIARVGQCYGLGYVVDVLLGANTQQIRSNNHESLSTYGLLKDHDKKSLTNVVYQLIDQGIIGRTEGDRPTLHLNDESKAVLRGERTVRLFKAKEDLKAAPDEAMWQGVDHGLFERLRVWRTELARQREVPAYVILSDAALRDLARVRPSTIAELQRIRGIGTKKQEDLGEQLISIIATHCRENNLAQDQPAAHGPFAADRVKPTLSAARDKAFDLFDLGKPLDEVAEQIERALSTTQGYLAEYVQERAPESISAWVDDETKQRVLAAAEELGAERLKPIYEHLDQQVSYESIRLVLVHDRILREQALLQ